MGEDLLLSDRYRRPPPIFVIQEYAVCRLHALGTKTLSKNQAMVSMAACNMLA
jgi:hypothetical protein